MRTARAATVLLCLLLPAAAAPLERTVTFDRDPGWEGRNNRSQAFPPRQVVQNFGYSPTAHAGGQPGELGGTITPDGQAAFYALPLRPRTLEDPLSASGKLNGVGPSFHVLIGFFNAGTVNEWRTPNSIALRLYGRGDRFLAYVEYCTRRWRAGGDSPGGFATVTDPVTNRKQLAGFTLGKPHAWSITYHPEANGGAGEVVVTLDNQTSVCRLEPGHRADGALFNRFGLLNVVKSVDGGGEVWLDDVTVLGRRESFDRDPGWDHLNNRRAYLSTHVRPRFDFGLSPTRYCGGRRPGELGGTVYRGDCRDPERMAHYSDRVGPLDLRHPLRAEGKVCLRRGVTDSTVLLGFFSSRESLRTSQEQSSGLPRGFLGLAIGGPSREGFLLGPAYRLGGSESPPIDRAPHLYPDGTVHRWSLAFTPATQGTPGRLKVSLDGQASEVEIPSGPNADTAALDRFGIVSTWVDGNAQQVYFDDLTYTVAQ